jgi:hypothetical protein
VIFLQTAHGAPDRSVGVGPTAPGWEWIFIAAIVLSILWMACHAWLKVYYIRHQHPPEFVFRLQSWWHGWRAGKIGGLGRKSRREAAE